MLTNSFVPLPDTQEELALLHNDIVLKLAIMQMQDDENEQVLKGMDAAETGAAYVRYKEKYGDRVKRLLHHKVSDKDSKQASKRTMQRILHIAAAIIAIVSLGLTTAIATVPAVRAKVLTLLMDVQERYTEIQLVENQDVSFFVPPGWEGEYFPSYIPPQFTFAKTEYLGSRKIASFLDASDNLVEFSEAGDDTTLQIDTENAVNEFSSMHGSAVLISTKNGYTSIVWMHNNKYFYLFYTGDKSEALKVVQSVMYIR